MHKVSMKLIERYGVAMKKRVAVFLMACLMVLPLMSCGDKSDNGEKESKKDDKVQEVNTPLTDEEKLYEDLFDINNTVSIQLEISQKELDKLQADYELYDGMNSKSPIYRMADKAIISIGDEVFEVEEVGIRMKGNTSRVPVYDEETGELNLSHYRLSFNETFDDANYYGEDAKVWASEEERQARKERTFATLKSMEVKWNKNYDDTHVREIYAYEIFRSAGILAQHVNVCSLGINGENYGVVNIYEAVDQIFIERNLPEEDWGGDLYKCAWTFKPANYVNSSVSYGVEDPDSGLFYNYDLKTNKKDSTYESIANLLEALSNADISKEDFSKLIDTDYLTKFLAVSYFTGNPDDIRNNYNNHYIYFLKSSGKAIFIPYDYDRCLGITYGWNPEGTGMTGISPFSDKAGAMKGNQTNPVIKKSILEGGYFVDQYKEDLAEIAASDFWKEENFEIYYEAAKQNYESVVQPTIQFANADQEFKFSLEGEFTTADKCNMSFEEYVTRIMETYTEAVK